MAIHGMTYKRSDLSGKQQFHLEMHKTSLIIQTLGLYVAALAIAPKLVTNTVNGSNRASESIKSYIGLNIRIFSSCFISEYTKISGQTWGLVLDFGAHSTIR